MALRHPGDLSSGTQLFTHCLMIALLSEYLGCDRQGIRIDPGDVFLCYIRVVFKDVGVKTYW